MNRFNLLGVNGIYESHFLSHGTCAELFYRFGNLTAARKTTSNTTANSKNYYFLRYSYNMLIYIYIYDQNIIL
jgi:hypothetical protein